MNDRVRTKKLKIGVFSTSSPISLDSKPVGYDYLAAKGYVVYEHPQVRVRRGYTAGTIQERVDAIHELLKDESVDILMAFWGGTNTNQVLPFLDYDLFARYPKPIIGFSDTSAMLVAVNKLAGIRTYMGPSIITFSKPEPLQYTYDYFEQIVVRQERHVQIVDSSIFADDLYYVSKASERVIKKNSGRKVFRHGRVTAEIIASNLQTLLVLAGTKYFPNLGGRMLFVEESETEPFRKIHRSFTQLSQIIDLNELAGICIGRFPTQCGFTTDLSEVLIYEDVFANIQIPIVFDLDFGHTDPLFTIPLGARADLDTQRNRLVIDS